MKKFILILTIKNLIVIIFLFSVSLAFSRNIFYSYNEYNDTIEHNIFSQVLFDDFINSDLNINWVLSGTPRPRQLNSIFGRTGIFDNNGNGWYNSEAYSRQTIGNAEGFIVESEVYLNITNSAGCWVIASIGVTKELNPPPINNDDGDISRGLDFAISYEGGACWGTPQHYRYHAWFFISLLTEENTYESPQNFTLNADNFINKWVKMKIVVQQDRYVKFFCDDILIWSSTKKLHPNIMTNKNLLLGARSSGSAGKAYHDWVKVNRLVTSIKEGKSNLKVTDFNLYNNYPNPFNNTTKIFFDLPKDVYVELNVFNVMGEKIKVLISDFLKSGRHEIIFDGSDLVSGTYFYQLNCYHNSSLIYSRFSKTLLIK